MISVIVPMFNAEQYIERCISSVLGQSRKDIEIICVDDHSTDRTVEICKNLEKNDNRIKVVINFGKGVSTARNLGLKMSHGDYIGFVDADDWIEKEMYEALADMIEDFHCDMAICRYWRDYADYSVEVINQEQVNPQFDNDELLKYILIRDKYRAVSGFSVNKLFRRSLLKDCFFDENLKRCEDVEFMVRLALKSMRVGFVDRPYYHYRQNSNSVTHSYNLRVLKQALVAYEKIIDLLKKNNQAELVVWAKRFYVYHASNLCEIAQEIGNQDAIREFQIAIKRYYKEYLDTNREYPERIRRIDEILRR